ncbi:MAG: hypothetical protein F7B17_05955 [Desulfurococcales archaeon]|nr:hypothetical protein [Desulfurococcales archaeon]
MAGIVDMKVRDLYKAILDWHRTNHDRIFVKLRRSDKDPYVRCYFKIIGEFPEPNAASIYDIACLATEQMAGLLEWAAPEKIGDNSLFQLSRVIVEHLGGWSKTSELARQSTICREHGMVACLERERKQGTLWYLERSLQ